MQSGISIVVATDANFAQHLGVTLCSLFENCADPTRLEIYVLDGGIVSGDRDKLSRLAERYRIGLDFVPLNDDQFAGLPTKRGTVATYYSLLIPDLPGSRIGDRALYLDSDMIVCDDLVALWEVDLEGHPFAAAPEPYPLDHARLMVPEGTIGLNTGVMLIDVNVWREAKLGEEAMEFARRNPERLRLTIQDALNAICVGRWLSLHPRWNVSGGVASYVRQQKANPAAAAYCEAVADPAIIHYTGSPKPWHYMYTGRLPQLYYHYLAMTEWRDYRPPDRTPANIWRKQWMINRGRARTAWRILSGKGRGR